MAQYLLFLVIFLQGNSQPSLTLTSSRTNPFVGETIELVLTIKSPSTTLPLDLSIPWLPAIDAARLKNQQLLQLLFTRNALPLRFQGWPLFAQRVQLNEYQFRFSMICLASGDTLTKQLQPIQLGALYSNSLILELRQPPPIPPSNTYWNLGVGSFTVTPRWQDNRIALGEETTLFLNVSSSNPFIQIPPPPWRTLPGWEGDRFLLEPVPPYSTNNQRIFPVKVRPRQLRATVPPILVRYFDPNTEQVITRQITLPQLEITSSSTSTTTSTGSSTIDAWNHLPDFRRTEMKKHAGPSLLQWSHLLLIVPALLIIYLFIQQAIKVLAPRWIEQRRWMRAQRQARRLYQDSSMDDPLPQALAHYFHLGLDRSVTNNWETYSQLALLSPHYTMLQPLIQQAERCAYGPRCESETRLLNERTNAFFSQSGRGT